jgi:predicted cupin superfamily sugar epimerase
VVPGGSWFALRCGAPGGFSLIGRAVAPGFDFEDFTLHERAMLLKRLPQHAGLIGEMTFERP